ncbi:MAG: flagellar hook-length control protein FliK, partial [bacterium]
LHPKSLGDVTLKVVQEDGGILRIDMRVDNLAAKQLLETHLNDLREKLSADNLADQFKFDVNVRKDNQHSELQSRNPETPANRDNRLGSLEMAGAASAGKRVLNHSGLSIYA